ncbi:hypothetical protein [Algivirga pacifica]|uniref:Tetratricopeptide repeat-containing protein n=1 Tax=Algivirga pacifica TaxID=1162670 RepID=A0ABP9DN86_9BACT
MKKFGSILLLFFLVTNLTNAQEDAQANATSMKTETAADGSEKKGCDDKGWCWGEDVQTSKEKYTFMSDEIKAKRYESAKASLDWLLANDPYLHKNLYIKGLKVYKALASKAAKAKDPKESEYEDMVLKLYDMRTKYFGKGDKNLSYQGMYYYRYLSDRPTFDDNLDKHLAFYEEVAEAEGKEDANYSNVQSHMAIATKLALNFKNQEIKFRNLDAVKAQRSIILTWEPYLEDAQQGATAKEKVDAAKAELVRLEEEFKTTDAEYNKYATYNVDWYMDKYSAMAEVIDYNIENDKDKYKPKWESVKSTIDSKMLPAIVKIDEDFVNNIYGPIFEANKTDVKVAKNMMKYCLIAKYVDSPYFLEASVNVFNSEPDAGLANVIAKQYASKDSLSKAMDYMNKSIELYEENPAKKAEALISLAKFKNRAGQKSAARADALEAAKVDESMAAEAYTLIGDLYYGSYKDCFDIKDEVKSRACYLAAYDMYSRAGNSAKMAEVKQQFPSMADIFQQGYEAGKPIQVGCWIGGTTIIRKRP